MSGDSLTLCRDIIEDIISVVFGHPTLVLEQTFLGYNIESPEVQDPDLYWTKEDFSDEELLYLIKDF